MAPAVMLAALLLAGAGHPSYTEPFRPQFHFTPAANWMNDPNGLVYLDGEYHLFFQYNPFADKWGHMSWGHAVSPDLVHWRQLPLALPEETGVMIFSGSAVLDSRNTSGLGTAGSPALVAVYTGYREADKRQAQHLAYSTDRGRTWTKYAGNPVLDIESTEFRDPKVIWHEPSRRWIMAVVLAAEHKVRFYGSPDLKQWAPLSDFGPLGAVGGVWECPDLFELPVDGDPGRTRWVLVVNLNPGGVAGGSGAQYFLGAFDGTRFTSDDDAATLAASPRWVDWGSDFYAVASWWNVPPEDGRRLWIGWMNNWDYGQDIPTSPWRSAQSLPREVRLKAYGDGVRLIQMPVSELRRLRADHSAVSGTTVTPGGDPLAGRGISGDALEIVAVFEPAASSEFGLKVRKGASEETVVGYDVARGEAFVDRARSGRTDFSPKFTGRHAAPLPVEEGRVELHVFVDRSSVEVFANGGRATLTDQIFPGPASDGVSLYAKGGAARLVSLEAWKLRSAWSSPEAAQ
jgi:fructan beta-fructosidase